MGGDERPPGNLRLGKITPSPRSGRLRRAQLKKGADKRPDFTIITRRTDRGSACNFDENYFERSGSYLAPAEPDLTRSPALFLLEEVCPRGSRKWISASVLLADLRSTIFPAGDLDLLKAL